MTDEVCACGKPAFATGADRTGLVRTWCRACALEERRFMEREAAELAAMMDAPPAFVGTVDELERHLESEQPPTPRETSDELRAAYRTIGALEVQRRMLTAALTEALDEWAGGVVEAYHERGTGELAEFRIDEQRRINELRKLTEEELAELATDEEPM